MQDNLKSTCNVLSWLLSSRFSGNAVLNRGGFPPWRLRLAELIASYTSQNRKIYLWPSKAIPRSMPVESKPTRHLHLPPQNSDPLLTTSLSQRLSSSTSRASAPAATMSTRPQREAAAKARKRVEDACNLYPSEHDLESDSETTPARLSAPRPTPVQSDDSSDIDSDAFVDDSGSDCSRPRKAALGKKRKRSISPMMDEREKRKSKAGKVERDDRKADLGATGFMVKSGNVMKNILLGKAGRASRGSLLGPAEKVYGGREHHDMRRAGLSDMGPITGSYTCGWRDEIWTKAAEGFALESSKDVGKGPVDGNGYRASRFSEHL